MKHFLFKSKLRAILLGAAIDESPVLSEHECPFGQWMQNFLLGACASFIELRQLETIHTDLHREARRVVKLHHAGAEEAALKGLDEMDKMADRSVELLNRLEQKLQE